MPNGSWPNYKDTKALNGLLVGFGAAYALDKNWSLGVDYTHLQLETQTYASGGDISVVRNMKGDDNLVRASLNYKF